MKKLIAVVFVLAIAAGAFATAYVPPKVWAPLDPILSADFNTMNSTLATAINSGGVLSDSQVTSAKLAANSVGSVHLLNNAVTARTIDSGAIYYDTQFAPGRISASVFVSSTDTVSNFSKMVSGYYRGDGTDTRTIYCTQQGAGHAQGGKLIPFTVTRVELYCIGSTDYSHIIAIDDMKDSGVIVGSTGAQYAYGFVTNDSIPFMSWSAGGYSNFVNSDSHGFRVSDAGSSVTNDNGDLFMWTAWGY